MHPPPRTISGLLILLMLLSSLAPLMPTVKDTPIGQVVDEMITGSDKTDDWDQLNDAQKKAMVDWQRNTDSSGYFFTSISGTSGDDKARQIATDYSGNAYVTGNFNGTVQFGDTSFTSAGLTDVFVAKIDPQGTWSWVAIGGGQQDDSGLGIAVDSSGNSYVTGYFGLTATFGSASITSLTSTARDAFVVKLSSSGSWLWAHRMGGDATWDGDYGYDISIDSSDNAYVVGYFYETSSFGSITLTSSGSADVFVAKISTSGSWLWALKIGGTSSDYGYGISVDSNSNAYVVGFFYGTTNCGSQSLSSSGSADVFVAKIDPTGSCLWAVKSGGTGSDHGDSISVDSSDNAYITGRYSGTADFGTITLTSSGSTDIFVAKISDTGSWGWAVTGGGEDDSDYANQIALDSSNNPYIVGRMESGTQTFGDITLTGGGMYVAKLSNTGSWLWVMNYGSGWSTNSLDGIAIDSDGNIFSSGYISSSATFGSTTLSSDGGTDITILRISSAASFDGNSAFTFATSAGGTSNDAGYGIAFDSEDNAYVTGYFKETTEFGETSLTSSGGDDVFVAKLSSSGSWLWAIKAGGTNAYGDRAYAIAVDSNDDAYITGQFKSTASFGAFSLTSSGKGDMFVAKVSSSGTWELALKAGGSSSTYTDIGDDIVIDSNDDIYITGQFKSNAAFGGTTLSSSTATVFVAKLGSSGSWIWAVDVGGTATSKAGYGVSVDASDDVYVTGYYYSGTATFSLMAGGSTTLTNSGSSDVFVAKLSSSGSWIWAASAGGTSSDKAYDIATDSSGNSYVTGNFGSGNLVATASFGSTVINSSYGDIFVAKVSSSGSWLWAIKAGGSDANDMGNGIVADSVGNAYVIGNFDSETATFGNITMENIANPNPNGNPDIFVAKVSSVGDWIWVLGAGGTLYDYGKDVTLDSDDEPHIVGMFYGSATIGADSLSGNGNYDMVMASFGPDTDGDLVANLDDAFILMPTQHSDQDGDGFGDILTGFHGDSCSSTYGESWLDRWGCPDMDSDGQSDLYDAFMQQPTQWNDTDGDGLGDNWDGIIVDRNDSTNGIGEYWVNAYLPDPSPLDYDNDGFDDSSLQSSGALAPFDDCPLIYGLSLEDLSGCVDSDGDGWSDTGDTHPGDGTQHADQDGDGYGDNANGNLPDSCPTISGTSTIDQYGCIDADGDGVSSQNDFNDGDAGETSDVDNDGHGDNADQCPFVWGNITSGVDRGCPDTDGDGWADRSDDLPYESTQYLDSDGDGYGDNPSGVTPDGCETSSGTSTTEVAGSGANQSKYGCPDTDSDGYEDLTDPCPFQFGNSWVDRMACPDSDQDGISDANDPYPNDRASGPDDWDGDGVDDGTDAFPSDMTQWEDSDNDGYGDNQQGNSPDAFTSDATQWSDLDGDGYGDNQSVAATTSDACPTVSGNSTDPATGYGCPDADGDGVGNSFDAFHLDATQATDEDEDGYGDNPSGFEPDECPNTYGTSTTEVLPNGANQSKFGCPDTDSDGYEDLTDPCPFQFGNSWVDRLACPDGDQDGISDGNDPYPNIRTDDPTDWDGDGFSNEIDDFPSDITQWADLDNDGYGDNPNSTNDAFVDDPTQWKDTDGDGYGDNQSMGATTPDACPNEAGESNDLSTGFGCPDADGDGVGDKWDDFDDESTQWLDSDNDGYGENPDGREPDECPTQAGESWLGGFGCPDADRDGWGDLIDEFPTDASQWADADGDGYGDSIMGMNPDTCPEAYGNSSEDGVRGCTDTDGDGWADDIDNFAADGLRWSDEDGDGISDQGDDDCPNLAGLSIEPWTGCPDMDGDGIMDLADDDTDGDGISNVYERTLSEMHADEGIVYDPYDANSTPADYDGDHIPDELDDDIDNDGYPNVLEIERGSDASDGEATPINMYGEQDIGFFYKPGEGFTDTYDPEAYEISASAAVALLTSEYLIPILMFPFVVFFAGRKRRRFKRFRRHLDEAERPVELRGVEEELDQMIESNKLKIHHALLLRNLFERKRDELESSKKGAPQAGRRGMPPKSEGGESKRYGGSEPPASTVSSRPRGRGPPGRR